MIVDIDTDLFYDMFHDGDLFPLYYDEENNQFFQEGGWVVYDIFTYITPNELLIFKNKKEDLCIRNDRHDFLIGLFYIQMKGVL